MMMNHNVSGLSLFLIDNAFGGLSLDNAAIDVHRCMMPPLYL